MLKSTRFYCPYCGERQETFLDFDQEDLDYWEDCQVCCSPIRFVVMILQDGSYTLQILRDDE